MKRVQATQTKINDETHATIEVAETSHTENKGHVRASREVDEQVVTTVVEYDTTLPADPVTGMPPIARAVTQVRLTADKSHRDENTRQTEETVREAIAETRQAESVGQVTIAAEKRGLSPLVKTLCAIGIIAVFGALLWVRRKLINKFLKPF